MARFRRPLGALLLLLAAIVVDAAVASPRHLDRELRAAACCAHDCADLGVACDMSCCGPRTSPQNPTLSAAPRENAPPTVLVVEAPSALDASSAAADADLAMVARESAPPPVFLLTRALRL